VSWLELPFRQLRPNDWSDSWANESERCIYEGGTWKIGRFTSLDLLPYRLYVGWLARSPERS
jgi:hypothetical protein